MRTGNSPPSIFLLEALHVSPSASPDSEKDSQTREATSPSSILGFLTVSGLGGLSGKTSPACCHRTAGGTLVPFSGRWENSGTGGPTECWTLNMSEWTHTLAPSPNDGDVCSLSDILEPIGTVPHRYSLSPKECMGILRRAAEGGDQLNPAFEAALKSNLKK